MIYFPWTVSALLAAIIIIAAGLHDLLMGGSNSYPSLCGLIYAQWTSWVAGWNQHDPLLLETIAPQALIGCILFVLVINCIQCNVLSSIGAGARNAVEHIREEHEQAMNDCKEKRTTSLAQLKTKHKQALVRLKTAHKVKLDRVKARFCSILRNNRQRAEQEGYNYLEQIIDLRGRYHDMSEEVIELRVQLHQAQRDNEQLKTAVQELTEELKNMNELRASEDRWMAAADEAYDEVWEELSMYSAVTSDEPSKESHGSEIGI